MSMFLWLLDFVTPSNNFFRSFSMLVYNNTIIFLRLIEYYLIIANSGLRPSFASIRQYTIHLREIIIFRGEVKNGSFGTMETMTF